MIVSERPMKFLLSFHENFSRSLFFSFWVIFFGH